MWTDYHLALTVDRLVAGIPAKEKMLDSWLEAKAQRMRLPAALPAELAGVAATPQEAHDEHAAGAATLAAEEIHGVVFYRLPDGTPGYEGRCLKGAFKEAANILKEQLHVKAFRSKIAEHLFVLERVVPIQAEIQRDDRPLTVMTMQGPRTSIKRFEFAENVPLAFTLRTLDGGVATAENLEALLEYMALNGLGSDRSQGAGTFRVNSFGLVRR
jgi:hypothetical protein